jgi:hypothetical protein
MSDQKKEETTIAWLKTLDLPASLARLVDIDVMHNPVDLENATDIELNTKAVEFMMNSAIKVDMEILTDFQEDFSEWSKNTWEAVNQTIRRRFRGFLREHGIYTGSLRGQIGQQLVVLLNAEEPPEWDNDDLKKMTLMCQHSLSYEHRQSLLKGSIPTQMPTTQVPMTQAPTTRAPTQSQSLTTPTPAITAKGIPLASGIPPANDGTPPEKGIPPANDMPRYNVSPTNGNPPANGIYSTNDMTRYGSYEAIDDDDAYQIVPPLEFPNQPLDPQTAAIFSKLWDKSYCYTGEPYNILDDKIHHFMETAKMAQIKPSQFHAVFPMILTKRAKEWSIYNVSAKETFTEKYLKIKRHFDVETNHHQYHTDWTSMTFGTMMNDTSMQGKSKTEVLTALLDKLQLCQRALGPAFAGDMPLRINTERAVTGVPCHGRVRRTWS